VAPTPEPSRPIDSTNSCPAGSGTVDLPENSLVEPFGPCALVLVTEDGAVREVSAGGVQTELLRGTSNLTVTDVAGTDPSDWWLLGLDEAGRQKLVHLNDQQLDQVQVPAHAGEIDSIVAEGGDLVVGTTTSDGGQIWRFHGKRFRHRLDTPGPVDALATRDGSIVAGGRTEAGAFVTVVPSIGRAQTTLFDGASMVSAVAVDGSSVLLARNLLDAQAVPDGAETDLSTDGGRTFVHRPVGGGDSAYVSSAVLHHGAVVVSMTRPGVTGSFWTSPDAEHWSALRAGQDEDAGLGDLCEVDGVLWVVSGRSAVWTAQD